MTKKPTLYEKEQASKPVPIHRVTGETLGAVPQSTPDNPSAQGLCLSGLTVFAACPLCGKECSKEFNQRGIVLDVPVANDINAVSMSCRDCLHFFDACFLLVVSIEVPHG